MAHNLDLSTGKPAIAYTGEVPWHGLGERLTPNATIEQWISAAQLDWRILREPVRYRWSNEYREVPGRHVLIRSDDGRALSVVSADYKVVQPKEVLEFYRDLIADSSFCLETAGALDEGRKVWALARSNLSTCITDKQEDQLDAFLLLATSSDKTLATTAAFTSIRVVCQNTLQFAMQEIEGQSPTKSIKVPHNQRFDPNEVMRRLKLIDEAWARFIDRVRKLADKKVSNDDANRFFDELYPKKEKREHLSNKAILEIQNLKSAFVNGRGQDLPTAKDTAWGLVNAVTYYVDHQRTSDTRSTRLDSAWFGTGALLKEKAWDVAVKSFCTEGV